jgi:hypothetical protein
MHLVKLLLCPTQALQHTSYNRSGACLSCLAHSPCNGLSASSKARNLKPAHGAIPEQGLAAHDSFAELSH